MDDPEMMKAADRASARYSGNAAKNAVFEDGYKAGWKARASAEDGMLTELTAALEPFARFCEGFDGQQRGLASQDNHEIYVFEGKKGAVHITLGHLRAAGAALSRIRSGGGT
jgi:hypothetical protein